MASRNERKIYIKGGIYHIYNRGVNKAKIFHNEQDYRYFEESFPMYLLSKSDLLSYLNNHHYSADKIAHTLARANKLKNYSTQVNLLAYCLMPNHFHILIKQNNESGMSGFLKSLQAKYSIFHALKYGRVGPLYQGRFRAVYVGNLNYYRIVLSYIHNNPNSLLGGSQDPAGYRWSSFQDYLGNEPREWIKTRYV